ncbi:peptide/bleomycin uptake transporter [Tistlia consotensis]|uniref:Peptide/bleomycin uptake transporter n=1 Tax=Tistlia consotensis USBA 355 TaxID=560819 RepID=A0A1Y6CA24_9PROT|nr:peptide antibiotic transporter SbmA [Tistlia consotensis]SMF44418.1 peptide/bleomycin uptake transporter [Tistlia consotensis USBA 355]SNR43272.1 peptide/bleomycin uptake transporter [Tistlia consotensis]
MFASFFPKPKVFFPSIVAWAALCMALWFLWLRDLGPTLSLGNWVGFAYPATHTGQNTVASARELAHDFWLYEYMIVASAIFSALWGRLSPHRWFWWSVVVTAVIIFITWFQVQLDVMINEWFGSFYNAVQKALGTPGSVTLAEFFGLLATFATIALVYITVAVMTRFLVSHYIFRWRTAMNDYYTAHWQRLRHIEGASQRVQEDTMRFASVMEDLGVSLVDSFMTLMAFLPILWGLSAYVKELPLVGAVPQALVFVAIVWSVIGTSLLALAGFRLPGLYFRNQRVEAAYRKELVLGEDHADRAQPPTLGMLFADVRHNYFRLYFHYMYFNVVRYAYLQAGVLVPYVALAPTIVSGAITLGVMQQIVRAFGRVETSFQYLVMSWTTIVELLSIYKRLRAFEATLDNEPLPDIEREVLPSRGTS